MRTCFHLWLMVMLLGAAWLHALPAVTDSSWVSLNAHSPADKHGVLGTVYASAYDKEANRLYIGGDIRKVGGKNISYVAMWDGKDWSALGSGVDGIVRALVLDASGRLYVGGDFTLADGSTVNHVAMWNGSVWTPLGDGLNHNVYALTFDDSGNLYAGGQFSRSGGTTMSGVAKWDKVSWSALGTGVNATSGIPVRALAYVPSKGLYVGGDFTAAGGLSVGYLALWNGSAWLGVGDALNGKVYSIVPDTNGIFVGGSFTRAGSNYINYLGRYNYSTWTGVGGGMGGSVYAMTMDSAGGNLYAGGYFSAAGGNSRVHKVAKWNRKTWSVLDSGIQTGDCITLTMMGKERLFAGGDFDLAGSVEAGGVAIWNGSIWWNFSEGPSDVVDVVRTDKLGNVWIAGDFITVGEQRARYIAKWDGKAWDTLGGGFTIAHKGQYVYTPRINDLLPDNKGGVYACGSFDTAAGLSVPDVAHWNGQNWEAMGTGFDSDCQSLTLDKDGQLVAGGDFNNADGGTAKHVARWKGSYWENMGAGIPNSVNVMLTDTSTGFIYAAGDGSHIYRWEGSTWNVLADTAGFTSANRLISIYGMALVDTFLYVSGDFDKFGGKDYSYGLGRTGKNGVGSDYVTGSASGCCFSSYVGGFLENDGAKGVYVYGSFTQVGGVASRGLIHFDGSTWRAMGSALDSGVKAVALDRDGDLWVGGKFSDAGAKHSPYFAKLKHLGGPQRVDSTGLSTLTYGDAPVKVRATSTLEVTLSSSDPSIVSVSHDTVFVHQAGKVTLIANQAGDAIWDAAPKLQWTLEVKPKSLTLNDVYGRMRIYDGSDSVGISGTPELVGVLPSDMAAVSLAGEGYGHTGNKHAGRYKFQVQGFALTGTKAYQYTLIQPIVQVEIVKAVATVTPVNASRHVGEANPAFAWTVSGLVPPDLDTAIHNVTLTTQATASSPAGSYTIEGSGGSALDYEVFYNFGTLTVLSSSSGGSSSSGLSSSGNISSSSGVSSSSSVSSSSEISSSSEAPSSSSSSAVEANLGVLAYRGDNPIHFDRHTQMVWVDAGHRVEAIRIYTLSGQLCQIQKGTASSMRLAYLPVGVYKVQVRTNRGIYQATLVLP